MVSPLVGVLCATAIVAAGVVAFNQSDSTPGASPGPHHVAEPTSVAPELQPQPVKSVSYLAAVKDGFALDDVVTQLLALGVAAAPFDGLSSSLITIQVTAEDPDAVAGKIRALPGILEVERDGEVRALTPEGS